MSRRKLHILVCLTVRRGRFIDFLINRPEVKEPWRQHTQHEFVNRIADGSLPVERFKHYLIQDYLYLVRIRKMENICVIVHVNDGSDQIQFARANALAAYKAKDIEDISAVRDTPMQWSVQV